MMVSQEFFDKLDLAEVALHLRKEQSFFDLEVPFQFRLPGFLDFLNLLFLPCLLTLLYSKAPTDYHRERQGVLVLVGEGNQAVVTPRHEKTEVRSQKSESRIAKDEV
mgnify:CR=1 FL=1